MRLVRLLCPNVRGPVEIFLHGFFCYLAPGKLYLAPAKCHGQVRQMCIGTAIRTASARTVLSRVKT